MNSDELERSFSLVLDFAIVHKLSESIKYFRSRFNAQPRVVRPILLRYTQLMRAKKKISFPITRLKTSLYNWQLITLLLDG